jgi:glc operon protein GlcG
LTAVLLAGVLAVSIASHGQETASSPPLVTRGRVALNLAGAELIIAQSRQKAAEMKVNVNIAVVDEGGHLLAFARMDQARPASASTAITKATAAATMRQPTGPVKRGDADADVLLNIALQNAAAASGGKMTSLLGGVPVVVNGQVIGAVGVGGGTGEQDAEVAKAGIEKLIKRLE